MNVTPFEALERLADSAVARPSSNGNGTGPKTSAVPNDKADEAWATAALEYEIAELRATTAASHMRNNQLNDLAFALGQLVSHYLDRGEVERELDAAAHAIGLDDHEIKATIRSGLEAGMREPRYRTQSDQYSTQHDGHAPESTPPENRDNGVKSVKSVISPEAWPDPPDEPAYSGLAGSFVRLVDAFTEADPVAVLGQFLAAFGWCCGQGAACNGRRDPPRSACIPGNRGPKRQVTQGGIVLAGARSAGHGRS